MDHLNWGTIQLGLVALAFGGLQVWWISSVFRRRAGTTNERGAIQTGTGADLVKATLKTQRIHGSLQKFIECPLVIERSWTGPLFCWATVL